MISIIVPVYNSEVYLQRCIDSIRNQTLKDFECLLVDDGSKDSSPIICDSTSEADSRFKTFHIKNGGVSKARNYGITHTSENSIFIGFVDSDDWIEPNMFELLLNNALKTNSDVSICNQFGSSHKINKVVLSPKDALKNLFGVKGFLGYSWNKLVKKELFKDNLFNEYIKCYEDLELFYRIFQSCNKVVWDTTPLYHYNDTPDSLTRTYGLTDAKEKGLRMLWLSAQKENNPEIKSIMQSHVYVMYIEICIEYITHSSIDKQGYSDCQKFIKENRNLQTKIKLPLNKRIWRMIILNNNLARLVSKIRNQSKPAI